MKSESSNGEIILYQTDDGKSRIQVRVLNGAVWLTQAQRVELFGIDKSGISRHLKNIFFSGELIESSVVAFFATTASDGKIYQMEYYNLDAIISVGYRVNSIRGTQFRQWATERLREYLIKGFTLDDERLKGNVGDITDYFDELLSRIRDRMHKMNRMNQFDHSFSTGEYLDIVPIKIVSIL